MRGGRGKTNYDQASIEKTIAALKKAEINDKVLVDCSHANSGKKCEKQPAVCKAVIDQITAGNRGIMGIMVESNLVAGNQKITDKDKLTYGQSITDECIDWETTEALLKECYEALNAQEV